ncbi:MAG: hypothetical protein KGD70_15460 [Candidatus Lokiarchaeota archaeon]|nr:hypothetical protein [Candidatus Lokiarchaeota archaeon]
MIKKRNITAFLISVPAGLLLFIKGIQGPTGIYFLILDYVNGLLTTGAIKSFLVFGLLVLILLSSLGGLTVIAGGFLIWKDHVSTGKFLIGIGAGISIFLFLFLLITLFTSGDLSSLIAQYGVVGWIGIILAFLARSIAR